MAKIITRTISSTMPTIVTMIEKDGQFVSEVITDIFFEGILSVEECAKVFKKLHPNKAFQVTQVDHTTNRYKMTVEQFMENAELMVDDETLALADEMLIAEQK